MFDSEMDEIRQCLRKMDDRISREQFDAAAIWAGNVQLALWRCGVLKRLENPQGVRGESDGVSKEDDSQRFATDVSTRAENPS